MARATRHLQDAVIDEETHHRIDIVRVGRLYESLERRRRDPRGYSGYMRQSSQMIAGSDKLSGHHLSQDETCPTRQCGLATMRIIDLDVTKLETALARRAPSATPGTSCM